jgi:hypothetical protein
MGESSVVRRGVVARRLELFEGAEPDELAAGLGMAFTGLANELRNLRLVRLENAQLRDENEQLRDALSSCVEACGDYLAPVLSHERDDADDPGHTRARIALGGARRLLDELSRPVPLL